MDQQPISQGFWRDRNFVSIEILFSIENFVFMENFFYIEKIVWHKVPADA